ncbi:GntR family transcriptional regulator [Roseomonas sp. KE0001]|uniref:GntR family transcriptional regulator n=1 Tax=Roseomonas sp. KE0001 TaxID=2479201 RepID=UPI0018DFD262|nr:GntR family transcriptional regulator [Roseomonas sp. KE0001]MBI0432269.1 GntR family transcriptional regulator [Roseomonas sp. KE0001]
MTQRVKPPTAQEAVLAELRRRLGLGLLRPGQAIPMEQLAEEFGVSRVPVREAMRILEGEGRVLYTPHRGYAVAWLDADDLREIYRLRDVLEAEAVRSAAPLLAEADLSRMEAATREIDAACAAADVAGLIPANRRFHFALFEACGMPRLLRILEQIWDASDQYRAVYFNDPKNRGLMRREHAAILRAARARDAAALLRAVDEHRAHAVPVVTRLLQETVAAPAS